MSHCHKVARRRHRRALRRNSWHRYCRILRESTAALNRLGATFTHASQSMLALASIYP